MEECHQCRFFCCQVPMVLSSLESVWNRPNIQSVVIEHEVLNVIIK